MARVGAFCRLLGLVAVSCLCDVWDVGRCGGFCVGDVRACPVVFVFR